MSFHSLTSPHSQGREPNGRRELELGLLALQFEESAREFREFINDRLKATELSELEFLVLCMVAVRCEEPLPQSEISDSLLLSAARTSRLLESLRAQKLIQLVRDDADRRRQQIAIEPLGQDRFQQAVELLKPVVDRVKSLGGFESFRSQLQGIVKLMDQLRRAELGAEASEHQALAAGETQPIKSIEESPAAGSVGEENQQAKAHHSDQQEAA